MKPSLLALVVMLCAGCRSTTGGPQWKSNDLQAIVFTDTSHRIVRRMVAPSEIEAVIGCLGRAMPVKIDQVPHSWTCFIDIGKTGRWVYDDSSGVFAFLTYTLDRAYRLSAEDNIVIVRLLRRDSLNQPLPTPPSITPTAGAPVAPSSRAAGR